MKEINEIKLVIPTQEYNEQVMECRRIFLENNETFAGCSGIEEVNSYEEWIDFEHRLSNKLCLTAFYNENYRGKGIGTKMLEFAKELGRKNNCTDIYITVNSENEKAIKVYENFGMRVKSISYMMEIKED